MSGDLESLLARVYPKVPGVVDVKLQGGAGDHGADVLVTFERGHPLTNTVEQAMCVVQVKSFEGDHWNTKAVDDIRRAFEKYPDATSGLIVSTARRSTPTLDAELERLRLESGKPVSLLIGPDVAVFVLRWGSDLLGGGA
jgi:hypothetical protein